MALHDVDYNNELRTAPMPDNHDVASERKADGTTAITQKVGTKAGAFVTTKDASILVNDGTTNVVQLGTLGSTGQYGLKVAKSGFDVTSTGNSNLIFNSNQNVFKIVRKAKVNIKSGLISYPAGAGAVNIGTAYFDYYTTDGIIDNVAYIVYKSVPGVATYEQISSGVNATYYSGTYANWSMVGFRYQIYSAAPGSVYITAFLDYVSSVPNTWGGFDEEYTIFILQESTK